MQVPKNPTAADYDRFVKFISDGAKRGERSLDDARPALEALETRKIVERAKGILMKMNGLSEDAAYRMIHRKSMDTCRSMKEIAESIILMADFQK